MSTSSVQNTAQIIQFPGGRRKPLTERSRPITPVADLEAEAMAVAVGEAWYHDAAIEDSKRMGGH
jgi:hypothetical protein